jgi:proteasome accessory factor B
VRFRGSLAGIPKQLLPTSQVTTDESGARVARLYVRNLRGLVRQALAWGPEAEVIEPAEARAMAREILASVVRIDNWRTR